MFLRCDPDAWSSLHWIWQRKSSPRYSLPSANRQAKTEIQMVMLQCGLDWSERISRLFNDNSSATIEIRPANYPWHLLFITCLSPLDLRDDLKECNFIEFYLGNTFLSFIFAVRIYKIYRPTEVTNIGL